MLVKGLLSQYPLLEGLQSHRVKDRDPRQMLAEGAVLILAHALLDQQFLWLDHSLLGHFLACSHT